MNDIQTKLLNVVDSIAPIREIKLKKKDQCPWFDSELTNLKHHRDYWFHRKNETKTESDNNQYKFIRSSFQSLNRQKMTQFFFNKGINDFKNNKLFWKFYSSSINIKSDKTKSDIPITIGSSTDPEEVCNLLNVLSQI